MSTNSSAFINTRLQPGVESTTGVQPFQRLCGAGKPLKRFWSFAPPITGLKPGANEIELSLICH
jgi:hypothetical protein